MIQIISDSSADIPEPLLEKYHIHTVPLTIHVNGQEYAEGIDITPQEFYKEMAASPELPKTSQPTPARYAQIFSELSEQGKILCFTVSSKLSGSFGSANLGKELSGNSEVVVFDTEAASIGHGLQVIKAAAMAQSGFSIDEILSQMNQYRKEMKFLILLDTLENIVKGGRLSRFQGTLARVLRIKAILHNVEGSAEMLEKVRGRQKSLQRVIALVGERCTNFSDRAIGITHVDNLSDAQFLAQELERRFHPKEIIIHYMGATIATYAGQSGLIVAF
ncbi:DegV family protein [Desulfosporosinus sp. I2]|uniref:DegV family protein n=1 Tax=Desulfosporosinus sp. I2 TaxID=1617025 RepID=UPI0005F0AE6F|nr:DegV family protein [Desulfosporosinus sp. I2]KJR46720.1 DegV family protein [Desulfosporosinus sp. I2]